MKACVIDREIICENIYADAAEIDENVTVVDGHIMFSSVEKLDEFVRKSREKYDIEGENSILYVNRDQWCAIVDDTSLIEEMAAFETPHEPYYQESVSVSTPEYHVSPKQLDFYYKYVKKMNNIVESMYVTIRNMRDMIKSKDISVDEKQDLLTSIVQYSTVVAQIKEQTKKIERNINAMTNQLAEVKSVLEYFVANFKYIKEPGLTEIGYELFDAVEQYCDILGSKKKSTIPAQMAGEDVDIALKGIRSDIKSLRLSFENQNDESVQTYLQTDPILAAVSSGELDLKSILSDPQSETYKTLFGGAAINDIGFLQRLFLNVDTSSSQDGVIPQLMMNKFDMIAQDNNNEATAKKEQLISYAKRMKAIGIDMESQKDMDFIFEKTSDGIRTGNIISVFSPEFRKTRSNFYDAQYNGKTADILQMIKDDLEYLDIFKFSFMHASRNEIMSRNDFDSEFYECCENIFYEMTGNRDAFRQWLDRRGEDAAYEASMRSKIGDTTFDEITDNIKCLVVEFWHSNRGNIKNMRHMNPFMIMEAFDKIKSGNSASLDANGRVYRFANLSLIPSKESGYNADFRKFFLEGDDEKAKLKRDFYNFVYDNFTMFQLLYTGKNSLRSMFLDENAIDAAVDAVKGVVRLDDLNANLRNLKRSALQWLEDKFYSTPYVSSDDSKVAYNYSDQSKSRYNSILSLISKKTKEEVDKMGKDLGIERSKYKNDSDYHDAIARKISLEGYNTNFYEVFMKSFDLYYAQKTRNEMYPIAKMLQRQYMSYVTEQGHSRENANERMRNWIMRAIQKIETDDTGQANGKLSKITVLRNILSRFDEMPLVSKFLNSKLMKRMSEDERELVAMIKKAKKDIDGDTPVEFEYEGVSYMRKMSGGQMVYMKTIGGQYKILTEEDAIKNFKDKLKRYYDKELSKIGTDATLQNLINLIESLLIYKMLAGVSTSGLFNRIEGHLANAEMDATGYYWTPGNLNYVEQFFLGAGLQRYITASGEKAIVKYLGADKDSQWIKRLDIIRKISDQTNIFQDMKNQFDRNVEGVQKGVKRHNFDLFQLSVTNPEFKNQMSVVLARMMDVNIKDKNGVMHKMFDKQTGEFTCFDIVDNKLVLKSDFDIPENQCWVTFKSTINNGTKASPSFVFAQQCKIAIKDIHGDYRKNAALGYNRNAIMRAMMMLRRWMPSKVMRGWSQGEGYNLMMGKGAQSGVWYDVVTKSKGPMMLLPLFLSTIRLHKGPIKTLVGAGGSMYMFCSVMKNRLGARKGQIQSNVTMLEESVEMVKAMLYEVAIFIPRNLPRIFGKRFEFDASKHSFNDRDGRFKDEYGEVTLGNFRACARQTATYFYLTALGVIAKMLFWNPDDGDDDDRRKIYNWMDNNFENILSSTTATLFMLDNIEDKADVGNIPIVRWVGDLQRFCSAVNEMNSDKIKKYGEKAFLPIRLPSKRNSFNPFENEFEYQKDTWDDRYIKNLKTDGEWGAEQDYKHIRADIKRQYVEMWKDKELPDYAKEALAQQMKDKGYNDVYDIPEKVFKDMVSNSNLIPSRKQKQYKGKDYKFMHDVLIKEYENNQYLDDNTLMFIFGGYDNRLKAYFQRMYNDEYQWVRDNPYIDDGD